MKQVVAIALVLLLLCGVLNADVPRYIHFQGFLTDDGDNPLSGTYNMVFRIYDVDIAGVPLWEETHNSVAVADGYYDITLGTTTALNLTFDAQYYLALEVNSDGEMAPRYQMCSAPYAIRAGAADDAAKLNGEDPSYYQDYNNLTNKPGTFPPEAHTHAGSDITSAVSQADDADTVDSLHASSVPAAGNLLPLDGSAMFPASVIPAVSDAAQLGGQDPSYYLDWSNFTNLPSDYTPSSHTHDWSEVIGKPSAYPSEWSIVSNKPATFPPESHTHPWADVTGKPATYAPEAHTHAGTDITSAVAQANNADTVDSFHASATPTANQLLPLDGAGMFPSSVIPTVSNAAQLGGEDPSYYLDWPNFTNLPSSYNTITIGWT